MTVLRIRPRRQQTHSSPEAVRRGERVGGQALRIKSYRLLHRLAVLAVMLGIAVFFFYPFQLVVSTAFKTEAERIRNPLGLPREWTAEFVIKAWNVTHMGSLMTNSLIVSAGTTVGAVFLSCLGGFAMARLRFPGRNALPYLLALGLVLPFEVLMVPTFYTYRFLGWLNGYWSMILPQIGLGLPFGILLIRGFVEDLPEDYFEAIELDGGDLLSQFFSLVIPLAYPAIVTLSVFQFLWSWNTYLVALVMVQNPALHTVPLGLGYFIGRYSTQYNLLSSAALIAAVPMIVLYLLFSRQILQTSVTSGLKG
jgi:raffinose/stachyose/melibiose transport system permease protein